MSESADRTISSSEIAQLAELFDRSEFAIDPTSEECKEATVAFSKLVDTLHKEKILPYSSSITLHQFRCAVRKQCRDYIRKNG